MGASTELVKEYFLHKFNLSINHPITDEMWNKAYELFKYATVDETCEDGQYLYFLGAYYMYVDENVELGKNTYFWRETLKIVMLCTI